MLLWWAVVGSVVGCCERAVVLCPKRLVAEEQASVRFVALAHVRYRYGS